ncbi:MAG: MoxR family ATPase [Lachnospiraceae bacterium]|nr:MoxR family ATPase [Lachnospiraceae bacterium]
MNQDRNIVISNVPTVSVNCMVDMLSKAYSKLINEKKPITYMPSVMLWGAPGVGKSDGVRQLAERLEQLTKKKTFVTDVRLLLFNPIDLRGIPTANEDKTLAVWLKPQIFQMDEGKDIINILFLDEITSAPPSVQAAAYQITLDRTIGEHRLPENCIVIAAGNRTTDKSVATKMPKALANRLLHLEIEISFSAWEEWAVKEGINPLVLGYLSYRNNSLMKFDTSDADLAFTTPRSWKLVSDVLGIFEDDIECAFNMISGLIGVGEAFNFRTWIKEYRNLPKVEEIFEGNHHGVPRSTSVLYALTSDMVLYAKEHKGEYDKIANSIKYAMKMPSDFSMFLYKQYLNIEKGYLKKLKKIPEFSYWVDFIGATSNAKE